MLSPYALLDLKLMDLCYLWIAGAMNVAWEVETRFWPGVC